jgi:murein DD-endopeptidase MepM/ murein hydrolase activator NlpD
VLGLVGLALLLAGCGQSASAHARIGDSAMRFWGEGTPAARQSPNGENTGPASGTFTYRITVVTRRVVRRTVAGSTDPIQVCPIGGRGAFSDDFGAPRFAGGFHLHAGNDIFAPLGTPILAPFPGIARATPNLLGGRAVTVYGRLGYVYNAHLVAYGKLGPVKAGDIVGYVGNTGDALGGPMHDHFEWHPYARPNALYISPYGASDVSGAIDPYPYLRAVCSG